MSYLTPSLASAIDTRIAGKTYAASKPVWSLRDTSGANYNNPASFVRNAGCWTNDLDLSSFPVYCPFVPNAICALIHPQLVLMTNHQPVGNWRFLGTDGQIYARSISDLSDRFQVANSDLMVAKLDSPLPAEVTVIQTLPLNLLDKVLNNANFSIPLAWINQFWEASIVGVQWFSQGGFHQLGQATQASWAAFYQSFVGGDSNSVYFAIIRDKPVLAGIGTNFKASLYGYLPYVNEMMDALIPGAHLDTVDITGFDNLPGTLLTNMLLSDATNFVFSSAKSAGSGTNGPYEVYDVHSKILLIGNDFVERTKCVNQFSTIDLTQDQDTYDLSQEISQYFIATMFRSARVEVDANYTAARVRDELEWIDYSSLMEIQADRGTSSGVPRFIAAKTDTTFVIWPPPNENGSWTIRTMQPFTVFTPGIAQVTPVLSGGVLASISIECPGTYTSTPTVTFSGGGGTGAAATAVVTALTSGQKYGITSFTIGAGGTGYTTAPTVLLNGVDVSTKVTLNIPQKLIHNVLQFGVATALQMNQIEALALNPRFADYTRHVQQNMGIGAISGNVSIARPSRFATARW